MVSAAIKDLMDNYQLDLLYTDGGVPFGNEVGGSMIAHLYNTDAAGPRRPVAGRLYLQAGVRRACGSRPGTRRDALICPEPWQTDTSIGDWYYNQDWKYPRADWVIRIAGRHREQERQPAVQRGAASGRLVWTPEVEKMLGEMAAWTAVNGKAIYGTRPWATFGEGPVQVKGGNFHEDFAYRPEDIRFTTKGEKTLYAFGWLAQRGPGVGARVRQVVQHRRQCHRGRKPAGRQRQAHVDADGRRPDGDPSRRQRT